MLVNLCEVSTSVSTLELFYSYFQKTIIRCWKCLQLVNILRHTKSSADTHAIGVALLNCVTWTNIPLTFIIFLDESYNSIRDMLPDIQFASVYPNQNHTRYGTAFR